MLSEKERAVRERLYFLDGTPYTRAKVAERERDKVRRLVEALLTSGMTLRFILCSPSLCPTTRLVLYFIVTALCMQHY